MLVQRLSVGSVVVQGGNYAPPHVVERRGTQVKPVWLQPQRQVVSPQTAAQMTAMMEQVVQNGSGSLARVPGFAKDETGKTGSSQIPVNGQYTQDVGTSYVGVLPAQPPRFTMISVGRKRHYPRSDRDWTLNDGYLTAAPISTV